MTSLARIIVSVSSLERSLPFYEGVLGLDRVWESDEHVRLIGDELEVLLLHRRTPTPGEAGVAPSFRVPEVDTATAQAQSAGATVLDPPADQPWGERQSILHDPDGHVVCLVAALR